MGKANPRFADINDYISTFPADVQTRLEKIRELVHNVATEAVEEISYDMPAFRLNGKTIVSFGGWKNHVALYGMSGEGELKEKLAPYTEPKGTIQFPHSEELPEDLIKQLIEAEVGKVN